MAAFFPEILDEFLTPAFLTDVRQTYHYGSTHAAEFQEVAKEMLPLLRREAFWERMTASADGQSGTENGSTVYEIAAMSLGSGVDGLQESYYQKDLLPQSYMLEVLAGGLLMRGYAAYSRFITENTGRYVAAYHFPGSEEAYPIELLPRLLKKLTPKITCNAAFCMLPQKSTVFIAELTKDAGIPCRGICAGCGNIRCSNRAADAVLTGQKRMQERQDVKISDIFKTIKEREK